ncbi:hypothetical protein TWF788_003654 [Orbilia oligospora]|uniref:Uncharacterized protein n=1 Tax=Orbilia oligospora TaxID=2813651 RepID=A0A7C8PZV5_ORBOL|nr:hypothetical protein TWF788_003654 [Orbilia oligospora]
MRPLRFSGCVGLWVYLQAALVLQFNHIPVVTAVEVEIPLKPDLRDYFKLNFKAFLTIGHQIDKLKIIRDQKCPTGDPSDLAYPKIIANDHFSSSLSYMVRKLRLAEDQLSQVLKLMQEYYISDPTKLRELLGRYNFHDITTAEAARDQLVLYRELFAEDIPVFGRFSTWLEKVPGQMQPHVNDMTKNLLQLSWKIEGATEDDFTKDRKLKVDTDARNTTLERFQDVDFRADSGRAAAIAAAQWGEENLTYQFKQYAHNDFPVAAVFLKMQKWYDCWEAPLSTIVSILANRLGPFPRWERED